MEVQSINFGKQITGTSTFAPTSFPLPISFFSSLLPTINISLLLILLLFVPSLFTLFASPHTFIFFFIPTNSHHLQHFLTHVSSLSYFTAENWVCLFVCFLFFLIYQFQQHREFPLKNNTHKRSHKTLFLSVLYWKSSPITIFRL